MSKESIENRLKELDIDIEIDYSRFEEFYKLLAHWNEKMDLTNIIEREDVDLKHFLDSLTLFKIPEFKESKTVLDVGTGAGFPGIPLKLTNEKLDITLLDSLNKRLVFLDEVIKTMNLSDIRTLSSRSEDHAMDKNYRESYDIVTSRAVSRLNKLIEFTLPLVKVGGIFVAMKGRDGLEEVEEAKNGISILGGKVRDIIEFNLFDGENERTLVVIEKIKSTPSKYPRNFGQIKKKPL